MHDMGSWPRPMVAQCLRLGSQSVVGSPERSGAELKAADAARGHAAWRGGAAEVLV